MKITIRCDKNYGVETFYPACERAQLFARIAGTKTLTRNTLRDIAALGTVTTAGFMLVTHPVLPVRNLREFLALARSRPGQLDYASSGTGTANHIGMELLSQIAGIKMQHVPHKGSAQAIADVIGGQIPLNFENIAVVLPHIKAGKVRALGVTSPQRNRFLPDVPTIAESGYPGFESVGWFGLMAPAAIPKDVQAKLNAETVRILNLPDASARILALGAEVKPSTAAEFETFNREQIVKWAKVIKESGARID